MKKGFINIFLSICLCIVLVGCGEENVVGTIKHKPEDSNQAAVSWADSHVELSRLLDAAIIKENIIYGYYLSDRGLTVVSQDIQSGEVIGEYEISDATGAQNITVDTQNNIYVLGEIQEECIFWKIDSSGQVSVWNEFLLEDLEFAEYVMPRGLFVDGNGYFYIWYEMSLPLKVFNENAEDDVYTMADRIYVKDNQLQTLSYEQIPNSGGSQLLGFSFDEKGTPTMLAQDIDGAYIKVLGAEKEASEMRVNGISQDMVYDNIAITEGGFVFCQGSCLYRYLFAEQSCEKIMDLATYGIFPTNIVYLGVKGEVIEIVDNYEDGESSEYTLLQVGESTKTKLMLGTVQAYEELQKAVTQFNRFRNDVQVEIVAYYDGRGEFEQAVEQLKLDIVTGKAPDILEVSMIDYEMLAEKDVWVDLYEYMKKDKDCTKEMLLSNVVSSYELSGHLYNISPAFQVYSMWGSGLALQDCYGVTLEKLIQVIEANDKDLNAIYGFSADEPVLTTLCAMGMDAFIDWEKGTCDFSGANFQEILEFARAYSGGYAEEPLLSGIRNGEILMTVGTIASVADYQLEAALYGDALQFIGYPVMEGTGTAVGFRGSQLAINQNGKSKDAAWDFIKYYLLNGYADEGFPVLKEQFNEKMLEAKEKLYETSVEGVYEIPRKTYMDENEYIEVYEATQSDIDAIKELVEKADCKFQYHPEIQNIINEEAEAYFAGQKTMQEVIGVVQNRVTLYLEEQE